MVLLLITENKDKTKKGLFIVCRSPDLRISGTKNTGWRKKTTHPHAKTPHPPTSGAQLLSRSRKINVNSKPHFSDSNSETLSS